MTTVRKFLRRRQVEEATGLACSSIYELMAKKEFPQNFPLSANRVAWDADEIAAWQEQRSKARAQQQAA